MGSLDGSNQGRARLNFCPRCGSRIEGEPKFCPNCGAPLSVYVSNEYAEPLVDSEGPDEGSAIAEMPDGTMPEEKESHSQEGDRTRDDRSYPEGEAASVAGVASPEWNGPGTLDHRDGTFVQSRDDGAQIHGQPINEDGSGGPARKSKGYLRAALIVVAVVFGLAILGTIVGGGESDEGGQLQTEEDVDEAEVANPFMSENGYPDLPAVIEATLSDQWSIGEGENGDSEFASDVGLEMIEDGKGYGTPRKDYMGFSKYKLSVVDTPDDENDGVNLVNFMFQQPWDTADLNPPGLTISNGNIYVRDEAKENKQGEYLGFIGDESVVDKVNEDYLACTGTPDIVGYQMNDVWELLGLLGIDKANVTVTRNQYQRISLQGAYMLDWVGLEGLSDSGSASARWGYLYDLYGKTEIGGREFYVGVEAYWSAMLEPVSENPWYDAQVINDIQLTTESLYPEISVMLSTVDPFGSDDMEAEASEDTEFDYIQYSNDPFPANSEFNYGLYPMDSSTEQIYGMADGVGSDGKGSDETNEYSGGQQSSGYQSVPYEDLVTYPENYLGSKVAVTGRVSYYPEEGLALDLGPGSGVQARVATNGLSYEFSDFKPVVTVYGTFNGLDTSGTTVQISADSVEEN